MESVRGLEAQRRNAETQRALLQQPDFLRAGTLRDYQLEGLNWLIYSWMQNNNCILADEMGLGKTIQCVAFIGAPTCPLENLQRTDTSLCSTDRLYRVATFHRAGASWQPTLSSCMTAGYLNLWQHIAGPYLVVVPLSTVPNWIREFRKWLPQVNALVYVGDSKSREVLVPSGNLLMSANCQSGLLRSSSP